MSDSSAKTVTIRIPLEIYDGVKQASVKDRRSLNSMISILLEQALKADA